VNPTWSGTKKVLFSCTENREFINLGFDLLSLITRFTDPSNAGCGVISTGCAKSKSNPLS
jgi:hypothetical protein